MKTMLAALLGVSVALSSSALSAQQQCGLSVSVNFPNKDSRWGATTLLTGEADSSAIFFVEGLHTNTDGTRRSYSVEDPWGERRALNNLCNAMHNSCRELQSNAERHQRMVDVKAAEAAGWPAAALAKTRLSSNVIVMKNGKPCDEIDGYLVSSTALRKPHIDDKCDLSNYVDALTVPALVIPQGTNALTRRGVKVGDLVVALAPGSDSPVYGVVGDTGDADKLGEASVAMNGQLKGLARKPANAVDLKNWEISSAEIVIFPATRNQKNPYLDQSSIKATVEPLFDSWGGVRRMAACAAMYRR